MRLIAFACSLLLLVYLAFSFVNQQQEHLSNQQKVVVPQLILPAYITQKHLPVEDIWHKLKLARLKSTEPVDKNKNNTNTNKDLFTIGEQAYLLYGIFNANEANKTQQSKAAKVSKQPKAFILIKVSAKAEPPEQNQAMIKLMQGEELSPGVELYRISSNAISFKQNNNIIKFNLFEAKKSTK